MFDARAWQAKWRGAAILALLSGAATAAGAESLSDPTRPWNPVPPAAASATAPTRALVLSSIVIAANRRVAVINGDVVRQGGRVAGWRVIAIEAGEVRLGGPQGYTTLKLLSASIKRAAGKATQ